MDKQNNVADIITEKPIIVRFGVIPFVVRPMTLSQIYSIGQILEKSDKMEITGEINVVQKILELYKDVGKASYVILVMMFRSSIMRFFFGRYIRKRLTMTRYKRIIEFGAMTFQAAFFLTSFTFLKGVKEVTKPTNTPEVTARGDSSEV